MLPAAVQTPLLISTKSQYILQITSDAFQENRGYLQRMSSVAVKSDRVTALRLPRSEFDSFHPAQILIGG